MSSTNVPDPTEAFLLPPGEPKIVFLQNERIQNSGTIVMVKEDHTLGNSIKSVLLRDQRVLFAGYRMPHPLEPKCNIQIQTTPDCTPLQAALDALEDLGEETANLLAMVESLSR